MENSLVKSKQTINTNNASIVFMSIQSFELTNQNHFDESETLWYRR